MKTLTAVLSTLVGVGAISVTGTAIHLNSKISSLNPVERIKIINTCPSQPPIPVRIELAQSAVGKPKSLSRKANSWLNIKAPNDRYWRGQIGRDKHGHAVFVSPEYSIRAGTFVLKNYYKKHKIDTIEGIVKRFSTNNHDEYIAHLCKHLKLRPDEKFDVIRRMPELITHMAYFETGVHVPQHIVATLDILEKI